MKSAGKSSCLTTVKAATVRSVIAAARAAGIHAVSGWVHDE